MNEMLLLKASELEAEARALRQKAFDERPLPDHWAVGQTVRCIKAVQWGTQKGQVYVINRVRKEDKGKPAACENQVFWVSPFGDPSSYYSTPEHFELYTGD